MTKISIVIKGKLKKEIIAQLSKVASRFLKEKKIRGNFLVYLSIVSENKIRELNYRYRKINEPTDVLSFPLLTKNKIIDSGKKTKQTIPLGDIFICVDFAEKQEFLFLHGLKHLLGFHHR